jgi:hypothetical protein
MGHLTRFLDLAAVVGRYHSGLHGCPYLDCQSELRYLDGCACGYYIILPI